MIRTPALTVLCLLAWPLFANAGAAAAPRRAPASAPPAAVLPGDGALCQTAVAASEQANRLPARLLHAIALVESGRPDPRTGAPVAWPWTINVAGVGHFYPTKAEAIGAVQAAQAAGVQSIDVGCMQINLMYHPHAFANLDEAFDPAANARYGASFLLQLYGQLSNWSGAVAAYHSMTPERGAEYGQRVAAMWPLADKFGLARLLLSDKIRGPAPPPPPNVDPYHVMTPEFRSRMLQEAAFRRTRDAAMGMSAPSASATMLSSQSHIHTGAPRRGTLRASLE